MIGITRALVFVTSPNSDTSDAPLSSLLSLSSLSAVVQQKADPYDAVLDTAVELIKFVAAGLAAYFLYQAYQA